MKDQGRRGWLAAIVADPWRKLAAVLLATMLWAFVDSRINQRIQRTLPLAFVGQQQAAGMPTGRLAVALPTDRVVGVRFLDGERPIDRADVVLSGPRFRIAALEREAFDLQVTRFLALDWSERGSAEFTAADLRLDQVLFKDVAVELRPPAIRIEVTAVASTPVTLSLDSVELVEGPFAGRWRRDTVVFTPARPVVLGKAAEIDALGKRTDKPFRAVLTGGGGADDRLASAEVVVVDAEKHGIRFATQPLLTVQLRPRTALFELDVPIVVDDRALPEALRGRWSPEAQSRVVRVQAGGDLRSRLVGLQESVDKAQLADWVTENLRLHVHLPRPANGVVLGPELDLKARLILLGPLSATVDRNECLLDEVVVVKLRQKT
jgi:hypothetical protein